MTVLVTGGLGFIGSNFIIDWLKDSDEPIVNLDAGTYAAQAASLATLASDARYHLVEGSIGDEAVVFELLEQHSVRAVVNFAAETHVDRSIDSPVAFFETNVMATLGLMQGARRYLDASTDTWRDRFRLIQVSTDEVFGTLSPQDPPFVETTPYRPNSPYAASKAASDHVVRAFRETYGVPVIVTNCSNNYGPRQYPEKLIPLVIHNALGGRTLPIYGDGRQRRDWLYVGDHCAALRLVLERGEPGQTYAIGGDCEMANLDVVRMICDELDRLRPRADGRSYAEQISHVRDRPGHDRRYAIDAGKIRRELGWAPRESFGSGLARTVAWYLDNADWTQAVAGPEFAAWVARQYA